MYNVLDVAIYVINYDYDFVTVIPEIYQKYKIYGR